MDNDDGLGNNRRLYSNRSTEETSPHRPKVAQLGSAHSQQPVRPDWFGSDDWWKSACSILAGDRAGLLLDTVSGDLIAMKNGKPLGTLFSGLQEQEWSWFITAEDPGVHVEVFGATVNSIEEVAALCRPSTSVEQPLSPRVMIEGMAVSTLSEVARPSSLGGFLWESGSVDSLGHVLDLLAQNAFEGGSDNEDGAKNAPVLDSAWAWGNTHRHISTSNGNRVAERSSDSNSFVAALGSQGLSDGVHEWEMSVDICPDARQHPAKAAGFFFGVSTDGLPLSCGCASGSYPDWTCCSDDPTKIRASSSHVWWAQAATGEHGQNFGASLVLLRHTRRLTNHPSQPGEASRRKSFHSSTSATVRR